jgi:hypothetical protein
MTQYFYYDRYTSVFRLFAKCVQYLFSNDDVIGCNEEMVKQMKGGTRWRN